MYLSERNRIFQLIVTIDDALDMIDSNNHYLIDICIEGLNSIYKSLEDFSVDFEYSIIKTNVNKLLMLQKLDNINFSNEIKVVKQSLAEFYAFVFEQKVKFKALFLPYEASTWSSMESIWESANNDPDCDAYVMPVPYYNLNLDHSKRNVNYDGYNFPGNIPIVDYDTFDIEASRPEVIFINNPNNETSTLTQVSEEYYSKNLINHTDMLVYSPYDYLSTFNTLSGNLACVCESVKYADLVLTQSKLAKKIYIEHGNEENKFLDIGLPKTDSIVNKMNQAPSIPNKWKDKINNKKVFLLTNYNDSVNQIDCSKFQYIIDILEDAIKIFSVEGDCALIWRPAPLFKIMLEARYPNYLERLLELENLIEKSDNCIVDELEGYSVSFSISHGLMSGYSSLVDEYMITKKPVLMLEKKLSKENEEASILNYNVNYFIKDSFNIDGISINDFVEMIKMEEDPKLSDRIKAINNAFSNLDGTVGENVYKQIKKELVYYYTGVEI